MYNMEGNNYQDGFQWGPFLLGILYLILGFVAFNNPMISIVSVAYVFAFGAILIGLYQIFFRRRIKQYSGYRSTALVVFGVIDIVIGIIFLFNIVTAIFAMHFIFAFWLIFDSIGTIVTASPIKEFSTAQYWFTIVIAVIGIILGFLLLFNPLSSFVTLAVLIGLYFMLFGVLNIVYAF